MSPEIDYLPPPDDPVAFESLCLDLWKEIWGPESDAQKHGRSGQPQAGVDVFGRDGEKWVGIQCKQKSELLGARLTLAELENEVKKARTFVPSLSQFIVATTGPRDEAVQERARAITSGGFRVVVWSWQDIWSEIRGRKELLARIGFKYWPTILGASGPHVGTQAVTVMAGDGGVAVGGNVSGGVVVHNYPAAPPPSLPPPAVPQRILLEELPRVSGELVGRDERLAQLDGAWSDPQTHIVTIVAWGGVGKTALVARWEGQLATRGFDGADAFDWSFYSQGTRDEVSASGEPFLNAALRFFGGEEGERIASSPKVADEKGRELAILVAGRKALLVLDGLEPLQYPPSHYLHGELKDPGIAALLKGLAVRNPGLCVVTTRESVTDLARYRATTAPEWKLEGLSPEAGTELLEKLQVKGNKKEIRALVEEVDGHALTLQLIGSYLRDAHDGDVRKRDLVRFEEADREEQGGHAFRVIEAYERWLAPRQTLIERVSAWFSGKKEDRAEGERQLAILRLLGLFDRPAPAACLAALRRAPRISGLTEPIVGLSDTQWNLAVTRLSDRGLLSKEGDNLDAHPLVREYFAKQLRENSKEACRAAHGRLFEHLRDSTPKFPDTLEGLQPLYQAVAHGCHAGRQQEACVEIYRVRILRGTKIGGYYSTSKLGALGTDLGAVACFFDPPWRHVSTALPEVDKIWLLNGAAFRLRALGRLTEALEPMRVAVDRAVAQETWHHAASGASNLSELDLTLGDAAAAVRDAEQSVTFADRSGDAFLRTVFRVTHADALHQAGRRAEALVLFREAERLQEEMQPQAPRLYSLQGFQYCDLLLAEAEWAAGRGAEAEEEGAVLAEALREVEERAAQTLQWATNARAPLLDFALNHLTLGRAALYRSILFGTDLVPARVEIEQAVDGLRRAGHNEFIAAGLLTRAWLDFLENNPTAARADLAEVQEIAERGPMPLLLADIAHYRGRLFGDTAALVEARRLIEKHGYGRRLEELADAEAAIQLAG